MRKLIILLVTVSILFYACKKEYGKPGELKNQTEIKIKPHGNVIKKVDEKTPCIVLAWTKNSQNNEIYFKIRTPGQKTGWVKQTDIKIPGFKNNEIFKRVPNISKLNKALFETCLKNNSAMAKVIINKGASVNVKNKRGETPLHRAIFHKAFDVAGLLIENEANVNARNEQGITPLMLLSFSGIVKETANLLIKNNADLEAKDNFGKTPFLHAAEKCNVELMRILAKSGADIKTTDKNERNALHLACVNVTKSGDKLSAVKFLIDKGLDIHSQDKGGNTPLILAAYTWSADTAKHLISKEAKVNKSNAQGLTALIQAASGHWFEQFPIKNLMNTVKTLLKSGAKINVETTDFTALMYACYNNHTPLVKLLLEKGAKVNERLPVNHSLFPGYTCLMFAARKGNERVIKMLVEKGEKVNVKNAKGETAQDIAIKNGKKNAAALIKSLLKK